MYYYTEAVKNITNISDALEAEDDSLLDDLGFLKKLLMNMQTSRIEKKGKFEKRREEIYQPSWPDSQ